MIDVRAVGRLGALGAAEPLTRLGAGSPIRNRFACRLREPLVRRRERRERLDVDGGCLRFGGVGLGLRFGGGLRLGSRGDIGGLSPATLWRARIGDRFRCRRRSNGLGDGAAPPARRSGGRRFLLTRTLLPLPPGAQPRNLVICQLAQMTADRHIHLTEQAHQLVAGDAELTGQVVHTQLDQTLPPVGLGGARIHDREDTLREVPIHYPNGGGRYTADGSTKLSRVRSLNNTHPLRREQRRHLRKTVS